MAGMVFMTRVRDEEASDRIRQLCTFVSRMERRYERSTETMLAEVREGRSPETREVGKWLAQYGLLMKLRKLEADGQETGSTSTNTN